MTSQTALDFDATAPLTLRENEGPCNPPRLRNSHRRPIQPAGNSGPSDPSVGALPCFAFDWGHGRKFVVFDGERHHYFDDIVDAIRSLPVCRLVGEVSFGSFDSRVRNEAIDLATARGTELRTISNRATKNYRADKGLPPKATLKLTGIQSDEEDARIIYLIAFTGNYHLAKPRRWEIRPETYKSKMVKERSVGWSGPDAARARALLPPAADAPEYLVGWQDNGKRKKRWKENMVLPMVLAAIDVVSRGKGVREFDRYVGAYAHGRNSQLRSNFYFWRLPAVCANDNSKENRNKEASKLKRGTRWIFSQVKQRLVNGPQDPSNDNATAPSIR